MMYEGLDRRLAEGGSSSSADADIADDCGRLKKQFRPAILTPRRCWC
jgi:hypothetical protein